MRRATRVTTLLTLVAVVVGAATVVSRADAASGQLREQVVPGVEYRAFTFPTSHGAAGVHVVTARLDRAGVRAGLLHAGAVSARRPVSAMARDLGAVAAVNGDFFHLTEDQHPGVPATGAPSGPAVLDGLPLKGAVPRAQRFGWAMPPGGSVEDVFGVGVDGRARLGRLTLHGSIRTPDGVAELGGLNQYALPVGGIGAFTPEWGAASRARAACGSDQRRADPCTGDTWEVTIRQGSVVAVADTPGAGAIPLGTTVLLGREAGARRLRELTVGAPVDVAYDLDAGPTVPFAFALGAHPLVTDRRPLPGLDTVTAEPRAAVGIAEDGRVLHLLSTDGRGGSSGGLTVAELADVLRSLGCEQAAYLDGGGSATLVTRGAGGVAVRNRLDQGQERPVPNGIGISATGA